LTSRVSVLRRRYFEQYLDGSLVPETAGVSPLSPRQFRDKVKVARLGDKKASVLQPLFVFNTEGPSSLDINQTWLPFSNTSSADLKSSTMGANQSKTPIANEKLIIERLRALETKDQSDNDYIHVDEKVVKGSKTHFHAPWTAVSVSDVGHWEHELLQDPKNRHVSSPLSNAPN
jgi:hypothetical protein